MTEQNLTPAKRNCDGQPSLAPATCWANGWKGKKKWLRQYQAQKGLCALCEKPLEVSEATKDHIVPKSKGGSPEWGNIWLTCLACNQAKADRLLNLEKLDDEVHAAWASNDNQRTHRAITALHVALSSPNAAAEARRTGDVD